MTFNYLMMQTVKVFYSKILKAEFRSQPCKIFGINIFISCNDFFSMVIVWVICKMR